MGREGQNPGDVVVFPVLTYVTRAVAMQSHPSTNIPLRVLLASLVHNRTTTIPSSSSRTQELHREQSPSSRAVNGLRGGSLRTGPIDYVDTGYGKSYILAALACLLIREGKRVVFLPGCRAMMEEGFGHYLSWALLLCFGDSPEHQQRVMECKNHPNKLNDLCDELASRNVLMYFVIDQANSFDLDLDNND